MVVSCDPGLANLNSAPPWSQRLVQLGTCDPQGPIENLFRISSSPPPLSEKNLLFPIGLQVSNWFPIGLKSLVGNMANTEESRDQG